MPVVVMTRDDLHPAMGMVDRCLSCAGASQCHCGWFPDYTITEDYALGMELKTRGYRATYLMLYLAEGEAPEEIRNVFRQRSRWNKGHFQVFFSGRSPLLNMRLPFFQRLWWVALWWWAGFKDCLQEARTGAPRSSQARSSQQPGLPRVWPATLFLVVQGCVRFSACSSRHEWLTCNPMLPYATLCMCRYSYAAWAPIATCIGVPSECHVLLVDRCITPALTNLPFGLGC
jgi:hypothetical protein